MKTVVITGGAGFIGSVLAWKLQSLDAGLRIIIIDNLGQQDKWRNISKRSIDNVIPIDKGMNFLESFSDPVDAVFHMGACSTTTESDADFLFANNVHYSMSLFNWCTTKAVPLIYASSAATYGSGEQGYDDDPSFATKLRPINKYGYSKSFFDQWVLQQTRKPPFWSGLKFFNVYGPNEYHKGSQASVVWHAFPQIKDRGVLKLFKSYREDIADGEQRRDFVYVKDVVDVMAWMYDRREPKRSAIFNVGTGRARSFLDLGKAVFSALDLRDQNFDFMDMPESLRAQYQYFTEAKLDRLLGIAGYTKPWMTLEQGVEDYVKNHLLKEDRYL